MENSNKKFRQYFLETLSPAEMEEIEMQIIADKDFAVELDAAETELMEDYLEDSLSQAEKKLFEENYLVTDERLEKLEFLKSFKQFAKNSAVQIESTEEKPSFFESLKNIFTSRGLAVAFGLLALVAALGIVWKFVLPANSENTEIASINQRDLSNLDEFKSSTNLNLIPETYRSGGDRSSLEANNLSQNVFFRLALAPNTSLNSTYQVKLLQNQKTIFTLNQVRIYDNQAGQELRLIIPEGLLKKGDYQIELEKETVNESKIIYDFAVR